MASPVVSIVIPTYNREHLLPIAVDSVRAQAFRDWELLIIDDHSTDGTRAVVETWSQADSRIKYLVNERTKGPAGARNTGIHRASGRYVAFLDSDDEWVPFHLEKMVYYLEKYEDRIDVMSANPLRKRRDTDEVYHADELDLAKYDFTLVEDAYLFNPDALFETSLQRRILTQQTIVIKRELAARIGYEEGLPPGPEDHFFHRQLAFSRCKVAHLQEYHVIYWAHADNLTNAGAMRRPSELQSTFKAYEANLAYTLSRFQLTPQQRRRFLNSYADFYVWMLGYHVYGSHGAYREARRCYVKGIRLAPWRLSYWKAFLASYVKQAITVK